jgi:hypothetical protein
MDLDDVVHPTEERNNRRRLRQSVKEVREESHSLEDSEMDDWFPKKPRHSLWNDWREMLVLWPLLVTVVITWATFFFLAFHGPAIPVLGNNGTTMSNSSVEFTTTLAATIALADNPVYDNHSKQETALPSQGQGVLAPANALSRANQEERWNDLVGLISRKNITPTADFEDPTTSAFKALKWMVNYDPGQDMEVISSENAMHMLETYALAVFFFATHPSLATSSVEDFSAITTNMTRTTSLLVEQRKHDWIHQTKTKCHWEGVGCGHRQNVVSLNVAHGHLAGTIPPELLALEHLIFLDVSFNRIEGTLPFEWATAWRLARIVNVSHNLFNGSVPDTWKEQWLDNPDVTLTLSPNENLVVPTNGSP